MSSRDLSGPDSVRFDFLESSDPEWLAEAWQELEARAECGFFLSWHWIGCWIKETGLNPAVLVGHSGERIVLLTLLVPSVRTDVLPFQIRGLHLNTTGDLARDIITTEYNGFLVDREWAGRIEADAVRFLLGGVRVAGKRQVELHLRNIPVELERAIASSGTTLRELHRKPSWRIDLAAIRASGAAYLTSLSANTRQQIRRSVRLYEERGGISAVRARDVAEAFAFMRELEELHQRHWTSRGEPGSYAYPFFRSFHHRLIETCLPLGAVELVRIAAGAQTIGYVYNFVYRGHVYQYQTGLAYESDARLKPGLVSHQRCIEMHIREGAAIYDFMAGDFRYKSSLGRPGPDMTYLLAMSPAWPLRIENLLHNARQEAERLRRMWGRKVIASGTRAQAPAGPG